MSVTIDTSKHQVTAENAQHIRFWLTTRGGISLWRSAMIGSGRTWTTPYWDENGKLTGKPHWSCESQPYRHIDSSSEIEVCIDREVKRFHVAIRMGSQGMSYKVTDGGTRRIRKEVEKAGLGAYYVFDYMDEKNCVIMAPDKVIPLSEWEETL